MSNLTVDGDSDYHITGTPDIYTPVSDGPSGTDAAAAHINGAVKAIKQLQTLLGNALTLKGSAADLVTRLSRVIQSDGALCKGTSFPGTPIDGQPFYRTDLNTLYIYDAGTTSWTTGLDAGIYALVDGTREFTGDVKIEKSIPALRMLGSEVSGLDLQIRENAGVLYFMRNTGTEAVPVWSQFFSVAAASGELITTLARLTGSGGFRMILNHSNTADRTYNFPDVDCGIDAGALFKGPTSIGAGSTRSLETFVSATGNLSGIHYYLGNVTLNAGHTLTVPAGKRRLIIIATGTITINGTITAAGAGAPGGAATVAGGHGTDQAGGSGGDNANTAGVGGLIAYQGVTIQAGAAINPSSDGIAGTQVTGSDHPIIADFMSAMGGAGGGGAATGSGAGGAGGGSIILIAPKIVLAASAVINTSGSAGTVVGNIGGGGGGAGNVYIACRECTDNGATFTLTGGAGGNGLTDGGAGAAGFKQINFYT